ncbi:beta-galactosidase [Gracilibacillus phocaeensis]|uniref:beta-galactosidase n=1 Tax=Gracilibacillus phocaeensis TaxID=2042304 RepID=UPI00103212C2|nr:beta-galactosidase [Gracilibacillus phocaeensis]
MTVIFYDEQFLYEGERPSPESLKQLQEQCKVVDVNGLEQALSEGDIDCLVYLHGRFFPKRLWNSLLAYLKKGKALLHIGGFPFRTPVTERNGAWIMERDQTSYHRQLNIHEILSVDASSFTRLEANDQLPFFQGKEALFTIESTNNFILHATKSRDRPDENGSSGPMDLQIKPLLKGISPEGRFTAAPAVLLENTKSSFAGGRWLFINQPLTTKFWTAEGVAALKEWTDIIRRGVTEFWMQPNYAVYEEGERPSITLQYEKITQALDKIDVQDTWRYQLQIIYNNHVIWSTEGKLQVTDQWDRLQIPVDVMIEKGQYRIECTLTSDNGEERTLTQGFWGNDQEFLQEGTYLEVKRDYFWKNNRPFPIVGQTYMTSDVARKFIFIPNPAVWDQDMADMKKAGINLIRTGLWTGWRHVMFEDGHPSEEVLRAIDAFILTAKKHQIEVTFNFFAFTPIAYEGVNPYLDPRSVKAQKRFIAALASRHRYTTNINWDLINEPSMFDPKRFFQGPRTANDPFEKQAFVAWLRDRHQTIQALQERWDMTPEELPSFEAVEMPEQEEVNFDIQDMRRLKRGLPWLDYTLFTMDMHNRWACQLTETLRSVNPKQLVTVGQDEALTSQRPTPFFYEQVVDYTTVHSWWMLDQLVWDGIFTKTPNKPNLIQETGIMYVETPDNKAKRSEYELRNMLERKYAYAFSTGGAGAVQWLWNTNFYMNNINESNIGALRADGSEKPEADVSYDFGSFIGQISDLFEDRGLEEIIAIFPYSNDFSNRKFAFDATTKLTRVLAYDMNIPFRAMSEYQLEALRLQAPRLIIVPSAHNFSRQARNQLIDYVKESGAVLLWTGPIGLDEYWQHEHILQKELGEHRLANILREELLTINGIEYPVSFGDRRIGELYKEEVAGTDLLEVKLGKGKLIWSPLPIELNQRADVLIAVYQKAVQAAGVTNEIEWLQGGQYPGIYGRKLSFTHGNLYIFVSEYAVDTPIEIRDQASEKRYRFTLEKERSQLFATDKQGNVIASYREWAIITE